MSKQWKVADDSSVRHVWACQDETCQRCGKEVTVEPSFYQENGEPICGECGQDMRYLRTEVRG